MRLALIGPRGAGKSTVARLIGERLGRPVVEIDRLVERRIGCSVAEFVTAHGWPAFRDVECAVFAEVMTSGPEDAVIDAGGGLVLDAGNRRLLQTCGAVCYLFATPTVLAERLETGDTRRPPLTDAASPNEEITRVLAERDALYRETATITVEVGRRSAAEVAEEILDRLGTREGS